jgi:DNA ligase (NAD+)
VRSVADLYRLEKGDMLPLERLAEKSAGNVVAAISRSRRTSLARLLYALGIPHVGEQVARVLAAHTGTLAALESAGEAELTGLRGIGPEIAASVTAFFRQRENRDIVAALLAGGVLAVPDPAAAAADAGPLAGLSFVFTGTLNSLSREQAAALVVRASGRSVSSVSRATSYVVVGSDPGTKALQAEKLGVPRLSESGFLALLKEKGVS